MTEDLHIALVCAEEHPALARAEAPPDFLSPGEAETFAALVHAPRRRKWIVGRWAAKRALCQALAAEGRIVPPWALSISNDPLGAPRCALEGEPLPGCLSISHRGEHAAAASSLVAGPSFGIDLEEVTPRAPAFVEDFFTPGEAAALLAFEGPARDRAVNAAWSAKEAVLKALGVGLRVDTRALEVDVASLSASAPDWTPLPLRVAPSLAADVTVTWRDLGRFVLTLASLGRGRGGAMGLRLVC